MTVDGRLVLESSDARLEVSPGDGGRISSLVVRGSELLVTEGATPMMWGSFPMVPFAGRIRRGRFRFGDRDVQLALNLSPHAIHGTVFERPWQVDDPTTLSIDLGTGWPFTGRVVQQFALTDDQLDVSLSLLSDEPMPAALGWHPWFRRRLGGAGADGRSPSHPPRSRFTSTRRGCTCVTPTGSRPASWSSRRRVRGTTASRRYARRLASRGPAS